MVTSDWWHCAFMALKSQLHIRDVTGHQHLWSIIYLLQNLLSNSQDSTYVVALLSCFWTDQGHCPANPPKMKWNLTTSDLTMHMQTEQNSHSRLMFTHRVQTWACKLCTKLVMRESDGWRTWQLQHLHNEWKPVASNDQFVNNSRYSVCASAYSIGPLRVFCRRCSVVQIIKSKIWNIIPLFT